MSRPPENIEVWCPQCSHIYQDWRRSVNLDLDKTFDNEYVDQCSSAVCPECGYKVYFSNLIVKGGVFYFSTSES